MLIMSPWPPFGRFWKMGRMACVRLMRPVTLVANMMFRSSSAISGALATPLTRPLDGKSVKAGIFTCRYPKSSELLSAYMTCKERDVNLRIVHQDVDISPLLGQAAHKASNLVSLAHVELHRQHLDAIVGLLANLSGQLLQ